MKKRTLTILDVLGISTASLCLIHCVLFPILSIIPFGFSQNHWVDVFFCCIGMFVVSKILQTEVSHKVKLILTISILLVLVGVVLEIIWNINTQLIVIGGIGMISGHLLNYKLHSK